MQFIFESFQQPEDAKAICCGENHHALRFCSAFCTCVLVSTAPRSRCYCSNGKIRFQSFFMLITTQPFLFASVSKASEKVPT